MTSKIRKYRYLTERLAFAKTMQEMIGGYENEENDILDEMDSVWNQMNFLEKLYTEFFVVPKLAS